jgi:hypothetical protein
VRRTHDRRYLINFKYSKIRKPPMKALQRCLLRYRAIEHLAADGTIEIRHRDVKADDAVGEDVHHDHAPIAFEQNRIHTERSRRSTSCPLRAR